MLGIVPGLVMRVAAASGLVSFMSFAYAFYKDVKIQESSFNQEWQEGEIYGIVFEGSPGGVRFETILDRLNERIETIATPTGLNLEPATVESLRRALIGLTVKGIVVLREDHTYAVPMAPAAPASAAPEAGVANDADAARAERKS
jgi:ribosomal protein L12E/L44/L45/RPP1/RPP2